MNFWFKIYWQNLKSPILKKIKNFKLIYVLLTIKCFIMKRLELFFLLLFLIIGLCGLKAQTYKTSWLGNTYGYGDGQWVQNCITTLYVSPDGRCFTNSLWDEGHHETGIYSASGAMLGNLFETQGLAITGDGTDIYVTHGNNPTSYLRKFQGSNTANRLWNVGVTGNSKLYDMVAKDGKIYATDPNNNRVIVYNTSNGSQFATFPVTRPSEITIDNSGYLWIVQSAYSYAGNIPTPNSYIAAPKILRYSTTGVKQPQEIIDVVEPSDLAMDNSGRLMVAESGPDLQIRYYKNITTTPVLDVTFGQQGGIYSGVRGEIQDTKFYKLNGLGVDQNNNLYVSLSGPNPKGDNPLYDTDLRKFNSSGQLEWKLLGKEFVDMGDVDPDDLTKFYTKDSRYTLNWNNMTAGSEWSYDAFTIDPVRYPHDPRGSVKGSSGFAGAAIENIFVRRIGGQKFMFGNSMAGGQGNLWIWRFNATTDGEIAIPCGSIGSGLTAPNCPYSNEWIWRDLNGNGQCESNEYVSNPNSEYPYNNGMWPDKNGNVWRTYRDANPNIRKLVCSGLDANGIPQYSFTPRTTWSKPSVFQDVHYLRYFPETDRMFIAGWPTDNPPIGDQGEGVRCIARYDNWSTNPTLVWKSATVDYPELVTGMSFDIAGDYIFVAYFGDNDQNNDPKNGTVYVYNTSNGARFSKLEPGPEVGGACGLIDIWDSGIRAVQRPGTNEYLIFLEEDGKAKTIIYRWCPTSDCFTEPGGTTKYEAENASLSGLTIYSDHTGYSGTGFVAPFSNVGQYAQFSVTGATAGSQNITIRYSNGQTNARTLSLYVNGTKVRQVSFPVTANWDTWADKVENVTLNAGNNTIKIQYDSGDLGQFNIDYISVISESTVVVTGVTLSPATANFTVGGTQQLTATVAPANATNSTVAWSSSNTSIATVSTSGLVTGIAAGSATITATTQDQGKIATCAVTVTAPLVITKYEAENASLSGLSVYNNHAGYSGTGFVAEYSATGQYAQFSVSGATAGSQNITIRYANGQTNARTLSLYVNGTKVRQVSYPVTSSWGAWADKVENVTLNAGNNTIKIQYDSGDLGQFNIDYISVTSDATVAVTGVTVTPSTAGVTVDGTLQLTATVAPSNATNKTVTWSSSNTTVATVSTSGLVTGIAAGSVTITATTQDQGKTATSVVNVTSPKYEAEDASLNGLTVNSNHVGYSGSGFVSQFSAVGQYAQFSIANAVAGSQNITIRYANGQTNARTLSLYVNGTKVRQVSYPLTSSWGTWADKVENVTLNAGNNTIKIQYDSGDLGQFNIDYLSLNGSGGMSAKPYNDYIQNETDRNITLYPNPAKTKLTISNVKPKTIIKALSMDGKVIYNVIANTPNVDINVSEWEKGIYFFYIETEATEVIIKAIVQ
jgi:uncharacterized protein YjdB